MTDSIKGMISFYVSMGLPLNKIAVVVPYDFNLHLWEVTKSISAENKRHPKGETLEVKQGKIKVIRNRAISQPVVIDTVQEIFLDNEGNIQRYA